MPAISALNGGVVKATPSATDLIPAQEAGGNTVPISVDGLINKVLASPAFAEAVDDRVAALLIAGTGVTITYNDTLNKITITAP